MGWIFLLAIYRGFFVNMVGNFDFFGPLFPFSLASLLAIFFNWISTGAENEFPGRTQVMKNTRV
jgi:hypothetical protein